MKVFVLLVFMIISIGLWICSIFYLQEIAAGCVGVSAFIFTSATFHYAIKMTKLDD